MHSADPRPGLYRRQLALFLAAILVPCLLLVVLSIRMISQERELGEKRAADDRQRVAAQISRELLTQLEKIQFRELKGGHDPAVVFVGTVEDGRLVPPWEGASRGAGLGRGGEYAEKIRQGEQIEIASKEPERAGDLYRQALLLARSPFESGYARLLLARAMEKAGRRKDAQAQFRDMLRMPLDVRDEFGMPYAIYAAHRLAGVGGYRDEVHHALRAAVKQDPAHAIPGAYILRDAAKLLNSPELLRTADSLIETLEHSEQLRRDFPRLAPPAGGRQSPWMMHGSWLVSVQPPVLAVRAEQVFAELPSAANRARPLGAGKPGGIPLGEDFPGLRISFHATEGEPEPGGQQRLFYYGALALALSVTLLGAFVLWQDVRREMHLAGLRSQFVSSVSHELRTPLTAIGLFAETLHKRQDVDPKRQSEYLETILNESQRLARLVDNVLDFSKIEQGSRTYQMRETSLAEVVRGAARALAHPLSQLGFRLRVDAEENMPMVRADADALQQAILNLLSNAMKYSGESREIEMRLLRDGGYAVVLVTDHGPGIPVAHQKRIFDRFYRIRTKENESVQGTGLGLTLVAHIVEAHGGKVELQSEPGRGSTFSILLPLEASA